MNAILYYALISTAVQILFCSNLRSSFFLGRKILGRLCFFSDGGGDVVTLLKKANSWRPSGICPVGGLDVKPWNNLPWKACEENVSEGTCKKHSPSLSAKRV